MWQDIWVEGVGSATSGIEDQIPFHEPYVRTPGEYTAFVSCYEDGKCIFTKEDFYKESAGAETAQAYRPFIEDGKGWKVGTIPISISLAQVVRNSGTVGTPVYKVSAAFLTKDGSTRKKLEKGTTTPASGEFVFTKGSGTADTITVLNADYDEGSSILITYEYDTASAIQIVNSAEEFPVASVVKVLVRGYDVCD